LHEFLRGAQAVIDHINAQGGFGFIAHPHWQKTPWRDWTVTGFTGLEIYSAVHDAFEENLARIIGWSVVAPAETVYQTILDRPYDALAKWDDVLRHGRFVGIGAADAHDHRFGDWKFAPYELVFQMVRTHLLARELTKEALYDALRRGHCYVGMDILSDSTDFTFLAARHQEVLGVMGDEVALAPGLRLQVFLPSPGRTVLYQDGRIVAASAQQQNWSYDVQEPGVYRVEVNHGPFPWIFSNPIYVRPRTEPPSAATPVAVLEEITELPGEVADAVADTLTGSGAPSSPANAAAP